MPSNRRNTTGLSVVFGGMEKTGIPPVVLAYAVMAALLLAGALFG